jgi:hypothetical protein
VICVTVKVESGNKRFAIRLVHIMKKFIIYNKNNNNSSY